MERKLTAILHADVAGYSRLMSADEEATLRTLHASRTITDSLIAQHQGRIVGTAGDSILAEFASVVEAVQCAVEIQQALKTRNSAVPPEQRMEFRIGINLGDVMVEGEQMSPQPTRYLAQFTWTESSMNRLLPRPSELSLLPPIVFKVT
jgi:class 3 adenylate cyclase